MLRFKKDDGSDYAPLKRVQLKEIMTERTTKQCISEDAPLLSFTIEQGVIDPSEKKTNKRDFLTKDMTTKKYGLIEYNDIIYNPSNIIYGAIGRNKLRRGVVSPIYAIFSTSEDPEYIEYQVKRKDFINSSLKYLEGTVVKLRTLKSDDFLKLYINLPCKEEQRKIADLLIFVDEIISVSEKEVTNLESQKKGAMQKLFSQELRFKADNGCEYLNWKSISFSELFEALNNNTYSRAFLNYEKGEAKNIHYGDILTKFSDICDIQKEQLPFINESCAVTKFPQLKDGDIIIADTAEDETVGKAIEIYNTNGDIVISGLHTMACRPTVTFAPKYLGYFINSSAYHNQLKPFMQGIKVTSIGRKNIANTQIHYPGNLEEQQKIADFLSSFDEAIDYAKQELETWKNIKKGLLQQMFE